VRVRPRGGDNWKGINLGQLKKGIRKDLNHPDMKITKRKMEDCRVENLRECRRVNACQLIGPWS